MEGPSAVLLSATASLNVPLCFQRKYEQGDSAAAQAEKVRLEEKQRGTARQMKDGEESWKPLWFEKKLNLVTGEEDWLYNGQYWPERNSAHAGSGCTGGGARFRLCPEIY